MSAAKYIQALKNPNVRAILDTIGAAEGAKYNTLYGGGTFAGYSKHPNQKITRWGITSTAAGKYQFLFRTWSEVSKILGLKDFSPNSQDIAAVYLLDRRKSLDRIMRGDIAGALDRLSYEWASLPPARYNQNTRTKKWILDKFKSFGGSVPGSPGTDSESDTNLAGILPVLIIGVLTIVALR